MYGVLGEEGYWSDVQSKKFAEDLQALSDKTKITVRINSPGGYLFTGQAIHAMLKNHKAKVVVRIEGLAASAASIVAMSGNTIIMPSNAMMMIHNPMTIAIGNQNELRKTADDLDKMREAMIAVYTEKTGQTAEKITELLDAETWLTASDAKELGFADIIEESKVEAKISNGYAVINGMNFDMSKFKTLPTALFAVTNKKEGASKVDKEKIRNEHNEVFGEILAEGEAKGKQDGILAERQRIAALQALNPTNNKEIGAIIAGAINDGKQVAEIANSIIAKQSEMLVKAETMQQTLQDAAVLNTVTQTPPADATEEQQTKNKIVALAKKIASQMGRK